MQHIAGFWEISREGPTEDNVFAILLPEVMAEGAFVAAEVYVFTKVVGDCNVAVCLRVIKEEGFGGYTKFFCTTVVDLTNDEWG